MSDRSRIIATVSHSTMEQFERFVAEHGLAKDVAFDQALLCFIEACEDLLDHAPVPVPSVLSDAARDEVARSPRSPMPTADIVRLMRGRD